MDRGDGAAVEFIGGAEPTTIVLVEHRPEWAARFELERARLAAALGAVARRIEHVGSTAVPDLAAKPIVDIMVTVADPDDEAAFRPALEMAGYVLRVREPGHRLFRTPGRDVHVHLWRAGSEDERRHLVFRDRLRASPADRALYERVKRDLAPRYTDTNDYAEAKTAVVTAICARADAAPT